MRLKRLMPLFLLLAGHFGYAQFRFNEYSFSNVGAVPDALGGAGPSGTPDWVEIRNINLTKGSLQTLSGWYISDDKQNLHKWQFPYFNSQPIKLDSGWTQKVFLCGHNKALSSPSTVDITGVELHANFGMNQTIKNGAVLYLTKVNSWTPYDSVHVKITQPDHSWGRYPNGTGTWRLYPKKYSPGKSNPAWPAFYKDYLPTPHFDMKPGYYPGLSGMTLTISDTSTLSSPNINKGYINYANIAIYATNDCTKPDTQQTASTQQVAANGTAGSNVGISNGYALSTTTLTPAPPGFMVRAIMHDATSPTTSVTPKYWDSFEAYGAYFDTSYKMNVTCVCLDTAGLFQKLTKDTAIPTLIDYFDKNGKELMRNQGQAMIKGKIDFYNPIGTTKVKKQWQFDFRAEDEYGYYYTNPYQFFQDPVVGISRRNEFDELIFRSAGEENFLYPGGAGIDGYQAAHIRDYFNHTMTMRHKLHFESAHYNPTYMLLNGANRGIYYVKEPIDSNYTKYYYQHLNAAILSNGIVSNGTPSSYTQLNSTPTAGFGAVNNAVAHWNSFYNWAMQSNTNVHVPALFNMLADSLDFGSLNDYTIYNFLSVNADYLKRSATWWKGLPNDTSDHRHTKWRCALANTDLTWGFQAANYNNIDNTQTNSPCDFITAFNLTWPPSNPVAANPNYPLMALWLKLMDNDTFRGEFLARYSDLLNGALSCDSLTDHLKYIRTTLPTSVMTSHVGAMLYDPSLTGVDSVRYWNAAMDSMKVFIMQRCSLVNVALKNCFNLSGPYNLCVDVSPAGTGYVILNSVNIHNFIWNGKYFDSVLMAAKAIPNQNYMFDHWETTPSTYTLMPNSKSDSVNFRVSRDVCIKAVFKLRPAYETVGTPMIPSGFSPNNDGNNDIFNIYGTNDATSFELEVYNRWGEMIFRSNDKSQGWDGTYHGEPVPVGVYAYRYNVVMDGKTFKSKGTVTLLR